MQVECQLVTNGPYCGDATGLPRPTCNGSTGRCEGVALAHAGDSQDEADLMWGGVGRFYYWIKRADLLARDWVRSWLVLHCG